jgi:hypothetical protein
MKANKVRKIVIYVLVFILLGIFFSGSDLLFPFLSQSEKIGQYELSIMLQSKSNQHSMLEVDEMQIPLPVGAARFSNDIYQEDSQVKQYLIKSDRWKQYREKILPQYGFREVDQLGALHLIRNNDEKINVSIMSNRYSRFFDRIEVKVTVKTEAPFND